MLKDSMLAGTNNCGYLLNSFSVTGNICKIVPEFSTTYSYYPLISTKPKYILNIIT